MIQSGIRTKMSVPFHLDTWLKCIIKGNNRNQNIFANNPLHNDELTRRKVEQMEKSRIVLKS